MSDQVQLQEILDRLRSRFFGKYRGTVIDVDASTMSVRANVPAVLGTVPSNWCQPCVPYAGPSVGVFMLPDIGSGVWIEFEGGDVSRPIWVGCFWRENEIPSSTDAAVKTVITTAGTISMDTGGGSLTLTGVQQQTVVLDSNGITLTADSGSVSVGTSGVSINNGALAVT
jgi:Type VI secretion system/phage-baseplate injector OB domain